METHATETSLRRLFSGGGTADEDEETVAHVADCRSCWRLASASLEHIREEKKYAPSQPGAAFARMLAEEARHQDRVLRAESGVAEIRQLDRSEQKRRIDTTAYMRTELFFKTTIRAVEKLARVDPPAAESLAELAREIALALPQGKYSKALCRELQGEALTHLSFCRRLTADFKGAHSALLEAQPLLKECVTPYREAFWLVSHAALSHDVGRFEQALASLKKALVLHTQDHNSYGLAFGTSFSAAIHLAIGQFEEACAQAEWLLNLPMAPSRFVLLAQGVLVEGLVRRNRLAEARLRFFEAKKSFEDSPESAPREAYLEAILLDAAGHSRDSEKHFKEAARLFLEVEHYKDAMLSLFALFEASVRRGALEKAADLCGEVLSHEELFAGRPQIRAAWEELLARTRGKILEIPQIRIFRQFFLRCWSVPTSWHRFEVSESQALPEFMEEQPAQPAVDAVPEARTPGSTVKFTGSAYRAELKRHEKELFSAVAESCGYSIRATARTLNLSRNTVASKMRKFGLARNGL